MASFTYPPWLRIIPAMQTALAVLCNVKVEHFVLPVSH